MAYGEPISVKCPNCDGDGVVYNGSYYCDTCQWALNDRTAPRVMHDMYVSLMRFRGQTPDPEICASILLGNYRAAPGAD